MTPLNLAELRAVLAEMTPEPWEMVGSGITDWKDSDFTMEWLPNGSYEREKADGRGIVLLRNLASALIDAAEERERQDHSIVWLTAELVAAEQRIAELEAREDTVRAEALEEVKTLFRKSTDARGGCKILSAGDGCRCFLCLVEDALKKGAKP